MLTVGVIFLIFATVLFILGKYYKGNTNDYSGDIGLATSIFGILIFCLCIYAGTFFIALHFLGLWKAVFITHFGLPTIIVLIDKLIIGNKDVKEPF